ncbi:MFS transporter [Acrocarpospora catenulata]|uniref:MFS transporter n=1 Tax=Acrocarpospora catenulata TaxID=2836182 RepID=UPI001BDB1A0F|nr:MFS transporter [Acrocarpospora catenulata]
MTTRLRVTLAIIAVTQLMLILDSTIVTIALPGMAADLGFTPTGLSWVINAYMLAFGGLLLLGGRTGDILGRRRALLWGVAIFTVASLAGGFATTPEWLILSRIAQGAGGALAGPATLALITGNFPQGPVRTRALAVFTSVGAAGAAIGLLAGGVLTDWVSWRWVMFVNVPIGLLIALFTPRFVGETPRQPGRFDLAGAFTSTFGMTALVYGLIRAAALGWDDRLALGAFVLAVGLLAAFLVTERRAAQPIMPLRLLAAPERAAAYLGMMLLPAAMISTFFFLTQFVQSELGFSPLAAGLAFLPLTVAIFGVSQLTPRLVGRIRPWRHAAGGMVLVAAGMLWISRIDPGTGYVTGILGPIVLLGLGMGGALMPLSMTIVNGVAQEDAGAASGLLQAMQQLGGSVGLAVLITVHAATGRIGTTFLVAAGLVVLAFVVTVTVRPRASGTVAAVPDAAEPSIPR